MVEVRRDARLHDARHVTYRREAAGAGGEEGENGKAPPLPVQPGVDVSGQGLARRHPHSVQQGQGAAEEAAQRHVPLLQARLCGGNRRAFQRRARNPNLAEEAEATAAHPLG